MWMNIMNIPRKEMGNRLANIGHHKPVVFFCHANTSNISNVVGLWCHKPSPYGMGWPHHTTLGCLLVLCSRARFIGSFPAANSLAQDGRMAGWEPPTKWLENMGDIVSIDWYCLFDLCVHLGYAHILPNILDTRNWAGHLLMKQAVSFADCSAKQLI